MWAAIALAGASAILFASSIQLARKVEQRFPAIGKFAEIDGVRIHYLEVEAGAAADLAPILFIHGASGNARDLHGAFAEPLAGRARMIFVDRPGAGYSARGGPADREVETQARYLAGLLALLGIENAVIVGHSLGAAVSLAMAVTQPERVSALMLVAPVSHPWPSRATTWYYSFANLPVIGEAFARLLAVPAGSLRYRAAVREVFAPSPVADDYENRSATRLVLRPDSFIANAQDVEAVHGGVSRISPRYPAIRIPVTVVTGDSDSTVRADIHSDGLARDIAGARLVVLEKTGHMPTYAATDRIIAEIETLNANLANSADTLD